MRGNNIKLLLIPLLIGLVFALYSCGGGSGSPAIPVGNSPGEPHTLYLFPEKTVAQTGSYVNLRAKLMDGNGNPIAGVTVNFTNLSITGVLSATAAQTNSDGIASVKIRSTTDGVATVVAEHSGLRDRRSIVFTSNDTLRGLTLFPVTVLMDVDGDGDGVYNEAEDFTMLQGPGDDTILVRATVSVFGTVVAGARVIFTADRSDAYFPGGVDINDDGKGDYVDTYTDSLGYAYATVKVEPKEVISTTSVLNVFAQTDAIYVAEYDNYFSGVGSVSVFLAPVVLQNIYLYVTPDTLKVNETAQLSVTVAMSTGEPAPDGTTVQLSATCGAIDTPFVQLQQGNATAQYTAPSTPGTCTITATTAGISDSVTVTVISDLQITGPTTINEVSDSATFTVSGGTAPYTITFSHDALSATPIFNEVSPVTGNSLTLTTDSSCGKITEDTNATITVTDAAGIQFSITLTVLDNIVSPRSAEVCENDNTCSAGVDTVTFYFCGLTPYDVISSEPTIIPDQIGLTTGTFTVDPINGSVGADTDVTLTVTDDNGVSQEVTVTVINQ